MNPILIALLVIYASITGTIAGFGTSTIMMPVLLMFFPAAEALVFVSIIHWFNALWRVILFRQGFNLGLIVTFGLSGIVAAYFGARTFFIVDEKLITQIIAAFLFVYSIYLWLNPNFKIKFTAFNSALGGVCSGFIAGIFGMGGAIRGAFLAAFNLPKEVYLANSALILLLIDSSRLTTYFLEGARVQDLLGLSLWMMIGCIVLSFIGVSIGKRIVDKIPQDKFRLGVAIFLLLLAVWLLLNP